MLSLRNLSEPIIMRDKFYNLGTFTIRTEFIISISFETQSIIEVRRIMKKGSLTTGLDILHLSSKFS